MPMDILRKNEYQPIAAPTLSELVEALSKADRKSDDADDLGRAFVNLLLHDILVALDAGTFVCKKEDKVRRVWFHPEGLKVVFEVSFGSEFDVGFRIFRDGRKLLQGWFDTLTFGRETARRFCDALT